VRRKAPLACLLALGFVSVGALQRVAAGQAQQAPPAQTQPPQQAPPPFDPTPVEAAVREFYVAYWRAWEATDRKTLASLISRDFTGTTFVPGTGVVADNYERTLAGLEQFFDTVRGQQMAWNRSLLTILVRNADEAIVAVRLGFVGLGTAQSEVSLEVVRKEADGHWRLLRRWSEKHL